MTDFELFKEGLKTLTIDPAFKASCSCCEGGHHHAQSPERVTGKGAATAISCEEMSEDAITRLMGADFTDFKL